MNTGSKAVLWIILIIIVLAGGFYLTQSRPAPTENALVQPEPIVQTEPAAQTEPAPVDTSDAALNQSAAAIDANLSGLDSDTKAMSSTDVPVTQTY